MRYYSNSGGNGWGCVLVLLMLALFLCIGPVLFFWAVKTLFGYEIAFTFKNVVAFYVLAILMKGTVSYNKKG